MTHRSVILDRPDQIARFRLDMIIKAFEMELGTGLRMTSRMPRVKDVARQYNLKATTKKQLVTELKKLRADVDEGLVNLV
jgi:hypothetical protein